jgi:hypothetical protein
MNTYLIQTDTKLLRFDKNLNHVSYCINFYQKHFKYSSGLSLDDRWLLRKEKSESKYDKKTCYDKKTKQVIFNVRNHANLIVIIYFGLLRFMGTFYRKKKKLLKK